jgi:hypothetical protein
VAIEQREPQARLLVLNKVENKFRILKEAKAFK